MDLQLFTVMTNYDKCATLYCTCDIHQAIAM